MDPDQYKVIHSYYYPFWRIFYLRFFYEVKLHQLQGDKIFFIKLEIFIWYHQSGWHKHSLSYYLMCLSQKYILWNWNFVRFQAKFGKHGTVKHIWTWKLIVLWVQQWQGQLFCGICIGEIYCMKLGKHMLFGESKSRSMMDSAGGMDECMT